VGEGLIGEQAVVGEWDPEAGLWLVRAAVPGPAGSAGLSLAGGVEVDVDVASPGTLAGLAVEAPEGGATAVGRLTQVTLVAVLGPFASSTLLGLEPGPPVRLSDAEQHRARGVGPLHPALGRTALARLSARGGAPLVRGLALLEASAAAATIGRLAGLDGVAREDAEQGSATLLELAAADDLRLDDDRTARELAAALRRAATLLGGRPDVVALAAAIDQGRYGPRQPPLAAAAAVDAVRPMPAAARAPHRRKEAADAVPLMAEAAGAARLRVVQPVAVDRSHLPDGIHPTDVAGVRAGVAEVEVQLGGGAGRAPGWWARATTPDGTTVALAPVVDAGSDAVARLLVPPSVVEAVEVDLTVEPGTPRPSPRLRAIERAVQLGQAAARAGRLRLPVASARWAACATAWSEAGDEARAGRARDGYRSQEAGPPLAVDPLLEGPVAPTA
jgi:hypothetical protein